MSRAHIVPLALAFLAGIVGDARDLGFPALAVGCILAVFVRYPALTVRTNVFAALALGIFDAHVLAHAATPQTDARIHRFPAVVQEVNARSAQSVETTLRLDDGSHAVAFIPGEPPPIGERLIIRGAREPFDEPRNPGEPSSRDLQAERGIAWRVVHATVIARAPPDPHDTTLWAARARAWASARLHATLEEPGATILAGALWGERGPLPPELRAEFQDTGTVHVLVTAGLHLGVVAALAVALFQFFGCGRISASLGTIAVVWAYAGFSGDHLPSVRAATMLSFALLARAAGRDAFSWNALAGAAIVVAAVRPSAVLSVSFGLSFSCVAAIFAFAKPMAEALERLGVPHIVREAAAVSVAAQLGTWPLSAATFLVVAPYAPLANLAVVPVVGVAMLAGFVALLCAPVPALATLVNNIVVSLLDWIVGSVAFVGSLPGAHAMATPPPPWTIVTYEIALAGAAALINRGKYRSAVAIVVAASALCLWPPRAPNHDLVITAIDVGQADALLVRTPTGHAYLVDSGGRLERGGGSANASNAEDVGERVVVPFLIRSGIHHLDAILLSHPHGDHAGGVAPALRAIGADQFADSGQPYGGHAYRDAIDVARTQHVPLLYPRAGTVLHTEDGVTLHFIGPSLPFIEGSNEINDNSLAFMLQYRNFRMLFTGDSGAAAERRFLNEGIDLHADVLKVGHHGSAYSSTPSFIAAVHPAYAIISVGRHNLFGHPAPVTIETLERAGARVCRTDEDGAITVASDGRTENVRSMLHGPGCP
ncbi:MAG: DNA internalization-related competence protein ComEC/Rec2 [Candidatus Eremiobacteraeota bacterium]|nr:DNA internalization-related competence protein ComEC/Rec2 [Candidatus Eremiobacteraeota bacterium]